MTAERALLDAPVNPFADPVVRLESNLAPPHVDALHAAVRTQLRRAIASVSSTQAAMVLVQGDPGQGKTHELALLRAQARDFHFLEIPPLKDAGAPFQHVLRYAVQGLIAQRSLERFLWDALRRVAVAVRDDAAEEGDTDTAHRLDALLVGGERFIAAFQQLAREERGLADLLSRRGRVLPPLDALDPEFARVICRIPDRDAEAVARDWLRGAELPDEDLRLLGVTRALESEARCFEILRSLVRLSPRPLALCFDQLESTSGLLGPAGVQALFTALMELYQQLPVCVVLMCQTQVWAELRRQVPQAALERIRELGVLALPTPDEAMGLVEARLAPLWAHAAPPYPSFPFPAPWVRRYVEEVRPSVRQLLSHCGAVLDRMRQRGAVVEASDGGEAVVAPIADPAATLAGELKRKLRLVEQREDLRSPAHRQERVRNALLELLLGAAAQRRRIGGVRIVSVDAPPKPKSGPRSPMVITVEPRARIALEVQSDDGRGAYYALERLYHCIGDRSADVGVLAREEDAPIGKGAKRTEELARTLEPSGGIVWLTRVAADRLVAMELLLDAASASEIWVGDRAATRNETLAFLLAEEDLTSLARLVSRPTPDDEKLSGRVLVLLLDQAKAMPAPHIASALAVDAAALDRALAALERDGKVQVALDRDRVPTVVLTRPS